MSVARAFYRDHKRSSNHKDDALIRNARYGRESFFKPRQPSLIFNYCCSRQPMLHCRHTVNSWISTVYNTFDLMTGFRMLGRFERKFPRVESWHREILSKAASWPKVRTLHSPQRHISKPWLLTWLQSFLNSNPCKYERHSHDNPVKGLMLITAPWDRKSSNGAQFSRQTSGSWIKRCVLTLLGHNKASSRCPIDICS